MDEPDSPTSPAASTRRTLLTGGLLWAVVLAVHARALGATFLWDDRDIALRWPEQLLARGALWTGPFTEQGGYYRPLISASYALDGWLFGQSPAGFHLTNLLAHATVAVLVMLLGRRLGAPLLSAAFFAGLWALMPRLTESVTWVSGRTDVFMTALALGAFLTWPRDAEAPRWGRRVTACLLLLLSLAAKETGLAGFVAIAVLEASGSGRLGRKLMVGSILVGLAGAFWLLRSQVLSGYDVDVVFADAGQRFLAILDALGRIVLALLDPLRPQSVWGSPGDVQPLHLGLGGAAILVLAFLGVRAGQSAQASLRAAWVLGVLALLAPLPWLPNPVNTAYADRFLYLPLAIGLAALSAATRRWSPTFTRPAPLAVAVALVAVLTWRTNTRISHYHDALLFWTVSVVDTEGRRSIAWRNLGAALQERLELADAELVYRHTLDLSARGVDAFLDTTPVEKDLANVLSLQGKDEQALQLRRMLALREPTPNAWLDVARTALVSREFEQAERALAQPGAAGLPAGEALRIASRSLQSGAQADPWRDADGPISLAELRGRILLADALIWRTLAVASWSNVARHSDATRADVVQACAVLCQIGDLDALRAAHGRLLASWPTAPERAPLATCEDERVAAHRRALDLRGEWAPLWGPASLDAVSATPAAR